MPEIGDRVGVVGAGMGGLLAARVLADSHRRVTIVERDQLPESGSARKGVPQGRHAHGLLPREAQILDEISPGLVADLAADGVPVLRHPRAFRLLLGSHLLCQDGEDSEPTYARSRPYLERQVRDRVQALPNVTIRDRCEMAGTCGGHQGIRPGAITSEQDPGRPRAGPAWPPGFSPPGDHDEPHPRLPPFGCHPGLAGQRPARLRCRSARRARVAAATGSTGVAQTKGSASTSATPAPGLLQAPATAASSS